MCGEKMKKRNKSYKPRQTSIPMLVNREIHETVERLEEHQMLSAFQYGYAVKEHFDYLVQMANMLNIAGQQKNLKGLQAYVDAINKIAGNIKGRYNLTNKFGTTATELTGMRDLVKFYDKFWKLQTTTFYNECVAELNAYYAELKEKRAA